MPPPPVFSQVLIVKVDKVACFLALSKVCDSKGDIDTSSFDSKQFVRAICLESARQGKREFMGNDSMDLRYCQVK